jgi:hypothetical protein
MFRAKNIVSVLVFCLVLGGAAWAQEGGWRQHDRRDKTQYNAWQQDQNDHRDYQDRDDRDDRDRFHDGFYGDNGYFGGYYGVPYGIYGLNGYYGDRGSDAFSRAQQRGFNDGVADGQHDAASGHSDRPTYHSDYRHADRGWNRSLGDRGGYGQAYRRAYTQGYQQGYNGGRDGHGDLSH